MRVEVAGEVVELLPERAAWWPSRETLILADVHLGKAESFRAAGSPIPGRTGEETLDRIDQVCERVGARRLIICGDFLHTRVGLTDELIDDVATRRASWADEVVVVPGNHDRALSRVGERWGIRVEDETWRDGAFTFRHEPGDAEGFVWCGHVHPAVRLRGGGDAIKLACFVIGRSCAVLPAFNRFTGGALVRPGDGDVLYAIAEDRVLIV